MSIPKEPRQLMINIMYLVLMALLALNVSAEVMNAFTTLDRGNQNSRQTVDAQLETTVRGLQELLKDDSKAKFKPLLPAADAIQTEVDNYITYVDGLRNQLIDEAGDQDGEVGPGDYTEKYGTQVLRGLKNKDVTTRLLVLGEDGEGGEPGLGAELKQRTLETRQRLIDLYSELLNEYGEDFDRTEEEVNTLIQSVALNMPFNINDEEWQNESDKTSWEDFKFGHMPLAAVLPLMSQMQSDLKVSEANLINSLNELAGGKVVEVDNFFPVFEADRSYVIGGEKLNAKVSVGAFSSALDPSNVTLKANGQRLTIGPDGKADFSLVASGSGPKTINLEVAVTNPLTGETKTGTNTFTYEVGSRSVAVSADKMNVFYMGVDNPITVSAAGVSSNDVRVSFGDAISGSGSGTNYVVKGVRPTGNNTTDVTVTAGGQLLGAFPFRVKPIPDPTPTMGGQQGGDIPNSTFRAQRGVFAELKNFDFDARCDIAGFQILYIPAREDALLATNGGGAFSGEAAALIGRAKPGDNYTFKNIKAKCPGDAAARNLGTMSFTIR
ncbi:GldM family protein [Neolewinella sp.]|uniref:type IX secretion system motor protein PorM/GldM n=1 Tax=Neolewinella sp. TaxID=2993543 RepID=UPI003B52FC8E